MLLIIFYVLKELVKVENDNILDIGKVLFKGFLMGVRGNLGVIFL